MSEPGSPTPESPTPEPRASEEVPTEATPVEPPTIADAPGDASPASEAVAPTAALPAAPEDDGGHRRDDRPFWDAGRVLVVAILVLVLGGGAGFLIGRSTADSGPTTLAAAVDETAKGDLPAGDLSLDQILGAARDQLGKGGGDLLGGLLGGSGSGGKGSSGTGGGVLGQILEQLGNQLGGNLGGGSGSTTPDSGAPVLGVALEAAAGGQAGAKVAQVTAGGPAADAGVRAGDVITAVDGKAVADAAAVGSAIRAHQAGDQITLTLVRDGASTDVKVRLGNASAATTAPTTPPTTRTT